MAEEPDNETPGEPPEDYDPAAKFTIPKGGIEWDEKPPGLKGDEER